MFDTHILYLGYYCPDELFEELYRQDKDVSVAAHKLEKQLISHLKEHKDVNLTVLSSIAMEERAGVAEKKGWCEDSIQYVWRKRGSGIALSNLRKVYKSVQNWLNQTEGQQRVVLAYAINPTLLWPLFVGRRSVKVVTICTEIPRFRIIPGKAWAVSIKKYISEWFNSRMDGYVFLSKQMNDVTNPKENPYIVIEGFPDIPMEPVFPENDSTRPEKLFYAGYLHKDNGVDVLLDGFSRLSRNDVSLVLCGTGDLVPEIQRLSETDSRICYLGSVTNDRVLKLEREATLLINPRKPDHPLTRYSFPSKTFEYFTSGTPTMMSRLDGIPEEYYQYCYTCDVTSADAFLADLEQVLSISGAERDKNAKSAFEFVVTKKSSAMQVGHLLEYLERLV
ncbi:MAG: glycosyltransferase [Clostridia bacterium]|nr:glycosyltransferase [Clostridia bacterium]